VAESDPKCTAYPTLTDEEWNSTAKLSEGKISDIPILGSGFAECSSPGR
jgi:hypothetical protein